MWDVYNLVAEAGYAARDTDGLVLRYYLLVNYDRDRLRRAIDTLQRAPLHELRGWYLVFAAVSLREIGVRAKATLDHAHERVQTLLFNREVAARTISDVFEEARQAMEPLIVALAQGWVEGPPYSQFKGFLSDHRGGR